MFETIGRFVVFMCIILVVTTIVFWIREYVRDCENSRSDRTCFRNYFSYPYGSRKQKLAGLYIRDNYGRLYNSVEKIEIVEGCVVSVRCTTTRHTGTENEINISYEIFKAQNHTGEIYVLFDKGTRWAHREYVYHFILRDTSYINRIVRGED